MTTPGLPPADFGAAIDLQVNLLEGGWVATNRPTDPGKLTYAGLTQAVWHAYRPNDPRLVNELDRDEVINAYRDVFWTPTRCDAMPHPLSAVVFQGACNLPWGMGAKCLQNALGVDPDGVVGPATLAAIRDPYHDARCFLAAQRQHYTEGHSPDIHGLLNRATKVQTWLAQQG